MNKYFLNNYILLIYPIILIAITFVGGKLHKKGKFNEAAWNLGQGKNLQAIACLGIILHHLTQNYTFFAPLDFKNPITFFNTIGILFTSIFFFFSGYGLITSVLTKPDYVKNFFWSRLPVIIIPFYSCNFIYVLNKLYIQRTPYSSDEIFGYLSGYFLLNGNSWFMIEIFFFYIAFFIIFSLIKKKNIATILFSLFPIFIIYISYKSGHDASNASYSWFKGEWWYNSTAAFIMGIFIAKFKNSIVAFIQRLYKLILPLSIIIFVILFIFKNNILNQYGYYDADMFTKNISGQLISFIAESILCVAFIWLLLVLNMKIELNNIILKKIGSFSLELYLIHDLFLKIFFKNNSLNIVVKYLLVITISIVTAFILHLLNQLLIKLVKKITSKKKYHVENVNDLLRIKEEKKLSKTKFIIMICIIILFFIIISVGVFLRVIRPKMEFSSELKSLENLSPGDEFTFGRFDTNSKKAGSERLIWIVLKIDGSNIMLTTKQGLTGHAYNKKRVDVTWKNSDLCKYLNEDLYIDMFSEYEKTIIINNPDDNLYLSLLSVNEADTLFKDNFSRELVITEAAIRENKTNYNTLSKVNNWDMKDYRTSWWWLRGTSEAATKSGTAPFISIDGEIIENERYVDAYSGAIRPVVWITKN